MESNFIGKDGHYTFIGIVEDRQDPLKIGRVRVRMFGIHSQDKNEMPTDILPWTSVINSNGVNEGFGSSPMFLPIGSNVIGYFLDGREMQNALITGIITGIPGSVIPKESNSPGAQDQITRTDNPDTPTFFTGEDISAEKVTQRKEELKSANSNIKTVNGNMNVPDSGRSTKYPYNHGVHSESGHLQETDDTPGAERIHTYHCSGSNEEYLANGDIVKNVSNDSYDIIHGNQYENTKGHKTVSLEDGEDILINNSLIVSVQNGDMTISVTGNVNLNVEGKTVVNCDDINLGGEGGPAVARIGDRVKVSSGSSAGLWPIVEGSSITKSK